uniref:Putative DNA helicase n=1 Tax=Thiomonas intermedia (strain K12) TaxID=75379 RepID=D5X4Y4_THIK1
MRRCTFEQASQPLPPLDFVLPGLLAGTAGAIIGPGAVGKTILAQQIGVGAALGAEICAGAGGALFPAAPGGNVTVILGEDPPEIVLHRLQALIRGLGLTALQRELLDETLHIHSAVDEDLALLRKSPATGEYVRLEFLGRLEEICDGQRLVILDPLLFFAAGLDENSNGDMGALMRALNQLAHKTGCAILILHHVGKSGEGGGEAWEKARGASALTTSVRLQINLTPPSAAECQQYGLSEMERGFYVRVAQVKANYAPPRDAVFLHKGPGGVLSLAKLAEIDQAEPAPRGRKGGRNGAI